MEYVVGALLTLVAVAVANKLINKELQRNKRTVIRYSQSYIYSFIAPMMFGLDSDIKEKKTQSRNYQAETYTRIVMVEGEAFWIKNNSVYVARVINGDVDKESAKQVDTMSMTDLELKKMMAIVETLREGNNNDNGNSGKS